MNKCAGELVEKAIRETQAELGLGRLTVGTGQAGSRAQHLMPRKPLAFFHTKGWEFHPLQLLEGTC